MDIKAVRRILREVKKQQYAYRGEYNFGFHDAIEQVSKMIDKQMREYAREKKKALKGMGTV